MYMSEIYEVHTRTCCSVPFPLTDRNRKETHKHSILNKHHNKWLCYMWPFVRHVTLCCACVNVFLVKHVAVMLHLIVSVLCASNMVESVPCDSHASYM